MLRRDFLLTTAAATAGVGTVAAVRERDVAVVSEPTPAAEKRALFVQSVAPQSVRGVLPYTLAKFAVDETHVRGQRKVAGRPLATLSPQKEIEFHGFGARGAAFDRDSRFAVRALYRTDTGQLVHHELWSHAPMALGGTTPGTLMTAFDDAFVGFEFTHVGADGRQSVGTFSFLAGGGEGLTPGIYVIAGHSAATQAPPYLRAFKYSGDPRAPIADSIDFKRDFDYLSFVVHGEWV
jgi:hypothetical protein